MSRVECNWHYDPQDQLLLVGHLLALVKLVGFSSAESASMCLYGVKAPQDPATLWCCFSFGGQSGDFLSSQANRWSDDDSAPACRRVSLVGWLQTLQARTIQVILRFLHWAEHRANAFDLSPQQSYDLLIRIKIRHTIAALFVAASYLAFAQYFLPYPSLDTRSRLVQRDDSDDWIQIALRMDEQTMVIIHTGIGLAIIVITALIAWHAPGPKWWSSYGAGIRSVALLKKPLWMNYNKKEGGHRHAKPQEKMNHRPQLHEQGLFLVSKWDFNWDPLGEIQWWTGSHRKKSSITSSSIGKAQIRLLGIPYIVLAENQPICAQIISLLCFPLNWKLLEIFIFRLAM